MGIQSQLGVYQNSVLWEFENRDAWSCNHFYYGVFQLLDLIIKELKSHMTCDNSMHLIGWNYSIQTGEQIL